MQFLKVFFPDTSEVERRQLATAVPPPVHAVPRVHEPFAFGELAAAFNAHLPPGKEVYRRVMWESVRQLCGALGFGDLLDDEARRHAVFDLLDSNKDGKVRLQRANVSCRRQHSCRANISCRRESSAMRLRAKEDSECFAVVSALESVLAGSLACKLARVCTGDAYWLHHAAGSVSCCKSGKSGEHAAGHQAARCADIIPRSCAVVSGLHGRPRAARVWRAQQLWSHQPFQAAAVAPTGPMRTASLARFAPG